MIVIPCSGLWASSLWSFKRKCVSDVGQGLGAVWRQLFHLWWHHWGVQALFRSTGGSSDHYKRCWNRIFEANDFSLKIFLYFLLLCFIQANCKVIGGPKTAPPLAECPSSSWTPALHFFGHATVFKWSNKFIFQNPKLPFSLHRMTKEAEKAKIFAS